MKSHSSSNASSHQSSLGKLLELSSPPSSSQPHCSLSGSLYSGLGSPESHPSQPSVPTPLHTQHVSLAFIPSEATSVSFPTWLTSWLTQMHSEYHDWRLTRGTSVPSLSPVILIPFICGSPVVGSLLLLPVLSSFIFRRDLALWPQCSGTHCVYLADLRLAELLPFMHLAHRVYGHKLHYPEVSCF